QAAAGSGPRRDGQRAQLMPGNRGAGDREHEEPDQGGRVSTPTKRGAETLTPSAPSSWRIRAARSAEPGVSPCRHRLSNATGTRVPSPDTTSPSVTSRRT